MNGTARLALDVRECQIFQMSHFHSLPWSDNVRLVYKAVTRQSTDLANWFFGLANHVHGRGGKKSLWTIESSIAIRASFLGQSVSGSSIVHVLLAELEYQSQFTKGTHACSSCNLSVWFARNTNTDTDWPLSNKASDEKGLVWQDSCEKIMKIPQIPRAQILEQDCYAHLKSFQLDSDMDTPKSLSGIIPRCSMYGIFTYIWVIIGVNVGKYSIHGASGTC